MSLKVPLAAVHTKELLIMASLKKRSNYSWALRDCLKPVWPSPSCRPRVAEGTRRRGQAPGTEAPFLF